MDLNGDGKHDWKDDMIAYHVYEFNEESKKNNDKAPYPEDDYRKNWVTIIIVALVIFKIISWIVS